MAIRVVAALVLGPLVLLAFYLGSPFADLLVTVAVAVASWEWVRICQDGEISTAGWVAVVLGPAALLVSRVGAPWHLLVVCLIGALVVAVLAGRSWRQVALVLAGPAYLLAAGVSILWIRDGQGGSATTGLTLLLWLLLTVWATDIFAYVVGRSVGGPKLAPRVSPKKTWSGLAGGVLAAAIVGLAFGYILDSAKSWALPAAAGATGGTRVCSAADGPRARCTPAAASRTPAMHGASKDRPCDRLPRRGFFFSKSTTSRTS